MKMSTLYAALSGALLLGTAALVPAQSTTGSAGSTSAHTTPSGSSSATGATSTPTTGSNASGNTMNTAGATNGRADRGSSKDAMPKDEYKREKDRIEADAKAAKEKCKSMSGNAKDVCQAEAKANEKVAKKELDYKRKPTEKNKHDLEKMKVEAAYEVAKEKCDDQKGTELASCRKQAKADKDRQMSALRGDRKTVASTDRHPTKSSAPTADSSSMAPSGNAASSNKSSGK